MKGTPHGLVENEENKQTTQKIEVWAQEILGIVYYIDKFGNVYQAEDIVNNKTNPKVIAKYVKNGEVFSIPEFGI
jgi:S-adenosylmethionine hydrolase